MVEAASPLGWTLSGMEPSARVWSPLLIDRKQGPERGVSRTSGERGPPAGSGLPDSGILGDGSPSMPSSLPRPAGRLVRHVGPPAGTPSTLSEHGPPLSPVRPPAVVSSHYRGSGCSEPLCRRWLQDRVERFLASSTAEAMDPSKIGFPATRQFSCLEIGNSYM